jgi:hypothetical protein
MTLIGLDSRASLGTDIEHTYYPEDHGSAVVYVPYPKRQTVRVILAQLEGLFRMSAPEINIVTEGSRLEEAWAKFLKEVRKRYDSAWLMFDVGPTRQEEIAEGLNAPEDEDLSEPVESPAQVSTEMACASEKIQESITAECKKFCESHGLSSILGEYLTKVKKVFSNIVNLSADIDYFLDDESADEGHIVLRVEVVSDQKTALAEYDRWVDWVIRRIPVEQRDFFTLAVRRV